MIPMPTDNRQFHEAAGLVHRVSASTDARPHHYARYRLDNAVLCIGTMHEVLVICRVMRHSSWETTRKHYAPGDIQRDAEVLAALLKNSSEK